MPDNQKAKCFQLEFFCPPRFIAVNVAPSPSSHETLYRPVACSLHPSPLTEKVNFPPNT